MKVGIFHKNQMPHLQEHGWKFVKKIDDKMVQMQRDDTRNQIVSLKEFLKATDYKAIKYAEGAMTEDEFKPIKEERAKARLKIDELESTLNKDKLL